MVNTENIGKVLSEGWRPYAWIVFLAAAVYASSLFFDLTFLDDNEFILDNQAFISDISNAGKAFTQSIFSNKLVPYYRPILSLSLMLDAQIGGTTLFWYHLTNIILHALAACLLFRVVSLLCKSRQASFLYAALFCAHPALAQAVAWIPGRNDILLGVFTLLSFLFLLRYAASRSFYSYISSIMFFGLALFTKESAIVLPALFVVFLLCVGGFNSQGKGWLPLISGWAIIGSFWYMMRSAALIFTCDMSTVQGMAGAVVKSAPALIQYLGKVFFPFNLSVYPTIPDTGIIYGLISILLLAVLLLFSRSRRAGLILFGASWFLSFMIFTFIRPSPECVLDFQEHRLYLPMMGVVFLLIGTGFMKDADMKRPFLCASFFFILILFSFLAIRHGMNFRDKWAFWGNAIRTSPRAAFIHTRYGFICHTSGHPDQAEAAYKKAIELDPGLSAVHTKLGLLYMDKKMYNEAGAEFLEEIRISPKYDTAYMCLGVARYRQGRPDDAVYLWKRALRLEPYSADACKNLAIYYHECGDNARASFYARKLQDMGVAVPKEFLDKL